MGQKQQITDLPARERVQHTVAHESGEILFQEGEKLSVKDLGALKLVGIEEVFLFSDQEDLEGFQENARIKFVQTDELPAGKPTETSVYDPELNLLIEAGTLITDAMIDDLLDQGIALVSVERTDEELNKDQFEKFQIVQKTMRTKDRVLEEVLKAAETMDAGFEVKDRDRRKHQRRQMDQEIYYIPANPETGKPRSNPRKARLQDISEGGLCMLTEETLREGQKFWVNFDLPRIGTLKGRLKVMRSQRASTNLFEIGAKFQSVNREDPDE